MSKLRKSMIVGVFAVVLSTVGIQASDMLRGVEGNLTGLVSDSAGPCGPGAKQLLLGSHTLCVDLYEASPGEECSSSDPNSPGETQSNLNDPDCQAVSAPSVMPWRYISFTQAQQMCARSGKRLPTNDEWYRAVSGLTEINKCVIDNDESKPLLTGSSDCSTPLGVHDMVGNVWEWVDEEVVDGVYNERNLPKTGYVAAVDRSGVVVETTQDAKDEFGSDYAWTSQSGVRVVIRGGFYGSGEDAGIFAQNLSVAPNFNTAGIGFRCVKDI